MIVAVNKLVADFVWNGKKPKIKRDTNWSKEWRRFDYPECDIISKSLQGAWIKRMHESLENQWMTIPSFYLENYGGLFIF